MVTVVQSDLLLCEKLRYNFDAEPMSSMRDVFLRKITFLALVKWLAVPHWAVMTGTRGWEMIRGPIVGNFKELNPVKGFLGSSWLSLGRQWEVFKALSINIKTVAMHNENPLLSSSQTVLENWSPRQKRAFLSLLLGSRVFHMDEWGCFLQPSDFLCFL